MNPIINVFNNVAKVKTVYSCGNCGAQFPKWAGQCQDCGDWNTLTEEAAPIKVAANPKGARFAGFAPKADVQRLQSVSVRGTPRVSSGLSELDRVLGGGLVPGSVILLFNALFLKFTSRQLI